MSKVFVSENHYTCLITTDNLVIIPGDMRMQGSYFLELRNTTTLCR